MNLSADTIKCIRKSVLDDVKNQIDLRGYRPTLMIIQTEPMDEPSNRYVRNKIKTCESVGIECKLIKEQLNICSIKPLIEQCAITKSIDGIIVQMPVNSALKGHEREILNRIPWYKDVDGLSTESVGRLWTNKECLKPATASGVMALINHNYPDGLANKKVSIINRSDLIGKPLTKMLLDVDATVQILHSKSSMLDIDEAFRDSNIMITGIGSTEYTSLFDDCGHYWIDCGITFDANGHMHGDSGTLKSDHITPTPHGIGSLTTAFLCKNILQARNWRGIYD